MLSNKSNLTMIDKVLVDALYINSGGGKILLDVLIVEFLKCNSDIYYLLDDRIRGRHSAIPADRVIYMEANFVKRHFFYLNNKFSKVFCFGNLPPSIKTTAEVFTFFHQPNFLSIPKGLPYFNRFKYRIKVVILNLIKRNTNYWLVQSEYVKKNLELKFNLPSNVIKILPFYPSFEISNNVVDRKKNNYLYVSDGYPHKNHKKLIIAFCKFFDIYKTGRLVLTVGNDFGELLSYIENKISEGYPIDNIGFVNRTILFEKYLLSDFLIFPSLTESFGLGLIEGVNCGCMVIGADLPYTFEVCEPTLTFDPMDENSIFCALEKSLNIDDLSPSIAKIKNELNEILKLLI